MGKHTTRLSILIPSFLHHPNQQQQEEYTPDEAYLQPYSTASSTALGTLATPTHSPIVTTTPEIILDSSPGEWPIVTELTQAVSPPDLVGDDPFANLSTPSPTSPVFDRRQRSSSRPASTSSVSSFQYGLLNAIPHSPLSPLTPPMPSSLAGSSAAHEPATRPVRKTRIRPAYTRPAFALRPSLPSLRVLARASQYIPSLPRGSVGAQLPVEPWDDASATPSPIATTDSLHPSQAESIGPRKRKSVRRSISQPGFSLSYETDSQSESDASEPAELCDQNTSPLMALDKDAESEVSASPPHMISLAVPDLSSALRKSMASASFLLPASPSMRPRSYSAPSPSRPDLSLPGVYGRQCASSWADPSGGRHGGYATNNGTMGGSASNGWTSLHGTRSGGGGGGMGGSGGDDGDRWHSRRPGPTHATDSTSDSSDSDSDEDDVPLAQKIPGALRAQRTIRRQVREERTARRQERAAKKERETREQVQRARSVSRPPAADEHLNVSHNAVPMPPVPAHPEVIPRGSGLERKRTVAKPSQQYIQEELSVRLASSVQLSDSGPIAPAAPEVHALERKRTVSSRPQAVQLTDGAVPMPLSPSPPAQAPTGGLERKRTVSSRPQGVPLSDGPVPLPVSPAPPTQDGGLERKRTLGSRPGAQQLADPGAAPRSRQRSQTLTGQAHPPIPAAAAPEMPAWDSRLAAAGRPAAIENSGAEVQRSLRPMKSAVALGRSATTASRPRRPAEDYGVVTRSTTEGMPERSRTIRGTSGRTSHERSREAPSAPGSRRPSGEHGPSAYVAPPMPPLPNTSPVNNAYAPAKVAVVQQRVFVGDMQTFHMVELGPTTTAGDVLSTIKEQGILDKWTGTGGWMVFEVAQDFGMERPIRNFEVLTDVLASWSNGKTVNSFIVKLTPFAEHLSRSAIPTSSPTYGAYIEYEVKRGKWNKRWVQLKENSLYLSKRDNGKDETFLCSLSNFDVYAITRVYKAPKNYIFALKSTDSLSFFEDASDYLHVFSCNEKEGEKWMQIILLARSYVLHQERNVLVSKSIASANAPGASLGRSGTRKRPAQPLVNVAAMPPVRTAQMGNDFAPVAGTLLGDHRGPFNNL